LPVVKVRTLRKDESYLWGLIEFLLLMASILCQCCQLWEAGTSVPGYDLFSHAISQLPSGDSKGCDFTSTEGGVLGLYTHQGKNQRKACYTLPSQI
jgi:hypothetical protein